jgi:uncharacterized membrane protein
MLTKQEDAREADLVSTWFARVGALALLVGAGFGYRYAVDRGLIGPGGRVALGIFLALVLVALGERTAARGWNAFAQAAAGGGIGLLYVTAWAAFRQYGLIDERTCFALLGATAVAGAVLALRHDSQALAVLATLGAFANPVVAGTSSMGGAASMGYVVTVDLLVLGLAYYRSWEILNWLAAVASWMLFAPSADGVSVPVAVAFVSIYQAIFVTTATANAIRAKDEARKRRAAVFLGVNTFVYVGAVTVLMTPDFADSRGIALGVIGAVYLALGAGLWTRNVRGAFTNTVGVIGGILAVAWAPIQLDLQWVPAVWAAEAAVALLAGYAARSSNLRLGAAVLMMTSVGVAVIALGEGRTYDPSRLFLSWDSMAYVVHVAALFVAAFALLRYGEDDERQAGGLFVILGNAMALLYVSLEATAYVERSFAPSARHQAIQFALTAVWSGYACVLVAAGVMRNARLLRYLGVGLFGATVVKLVVVDVWLLGTGYRTLVFAGLGILLLACSLMYSRFKELLLAERQ